MLGGVAVHHAIYLINIFLRPLLVAQFRVDLCQQHVAFLVGVGGKRVVMDALQSVLECRVPLFLRHGEFTGGGIDIGFVFEQHVVIDEC